MEVRRPLSWCMRGLMVFFWIGVLALFLFLSRLTLFMPTRSITVLTWSETFDRASVKEFERRTGIKVYLSYYSSNEELLVKMRAGAGVGYDLVLPSDYAVERLITEGLLKKIDKQKIVDVALLNPRLMGLPFDKNNEYALPFVCELFCVAFNKRTLNVRQGVTPFDLIFNKKAGGPGYKIVMTNDPLEAVCFASSYLFGMVNPLNKKEQQQVLKLLKEQRHWVEAYANMRSDYLLISGAVDAALMQSAEIWRAMRSYDYLGIMLPEQPFISIEHCALPAASKKEELVYEFLHYFYSKEALKEQFKTFSIIPARLDVIDELAVAESQKEALRLSPKMFTKFFFMRDILPEQQRIDLWVAVKA